MAPAGATPALASPTTRMPWGPKRAPELVGRVLGGREDVVGAARRQVAVEAQARQRPDVLVDPAQALVGHAAERVPGRLVAHDAARDALQAGAAQRLGQALHRRVAAVVTAGERARAEGRVAAALEHEVAGERAVRSIGAADHRRVSSVPVTP